MLSEARIARPARAQSVTNIQAPRTLIWPLARGRPAVPAPWASKSRSPKALIGLPRRWLLVASVGLTLIAIGCELLVPRASQGLVDAAVAGPANAGRAWRAWLFFVGVYLAFALLRNLAMRFWNPLSVWTMQEMT